MMSDRPADRILDGAREALSVAKGEQPASRLFVNGHSYAPAARVAELEAALRNLANEMRHMLRANPSKDGGLYRLRLTEADAALAGHAPAEGEAKEPVAWRYRWPKNDGSDGEWLFTCDNEEAVTLAADDGDYEPLYAHPPAEPKP